MAAADSPSDATFTWTTDRGWQRVPWRVDWIGDDGSMLTQHPAVWRDIDGAILAEFDGDAVRSLARSGDRLVVVTGGGSWVLDLGDRTARPLGFIDFPNLSPDGHRIYWFGANGGASIRTL